MQGCRQRRGMEEHPEYKETALASEYASLAIRFCPMLENSSLGKLTFVTTLAAPIVQPLPIVTFGRIVTFPPIQQSSPIVMWPPSSGPLVPLRRSGSIGWVLLYNDTFGPIIVREPIITAHVSRMVQLKLMKTLLPVFILNP